MTQDFTLVEINTEVLDSNLNQNFTTLENAEKETSATLSYHISNIDNPHNTTASQVGAYTISQADAALALKADKTYVDVGLAAKASNGDLVSERIRAEGAENALSLDINALDATTQAELNTKADKVYVDTSLAYKADNSSVVHLAGTEAVTGNKTFTNPSNTYYGNGSNLTGLYQSQISGLTTTDAPTFAGLNINDVTNNISCQLGSLNSSLLMNLATINDTAGNSTAFVIQRKRITGGALQSGDIMGKYLVNGYSDTTTNRSTGGIIFYATENWDATHSGTEVKFATTTNGATSRTERWLVDNAGVFAPCADNTYTLGKSGARPSQLWAATATINTSDERQKEQVKSLSEDERFDALFSQLNPVSYKWKDYTDKIKGTTSDAAGNETEVEIDNPHVFKRLHHGMIAQQVEKAMNDCGITSEEFAGLIKDKDTGEYGLRYEEFIPMLIKQVQDLKQEIQILKTQIH